MTDTRHDTANGPADKADGPPRLTRLTFRGPLSEARAGALVRRLALAEPGTVLDLGCGWGELMLRVLAAVRGRGSPVSMWTPRISAVAGGPPRRGDLPTVAGSSRSPPSAPRGATPIWSCASVRVMSSPRPSRRTTSPRPCGNCAAGPRRRTRAARRGLLATHPVRSRAVRHVARGVRERPSRPGDPRRPRRGGRVPALGVAPLGEGGEASLAEWEEFESGYQADAEVWLVGRGDHPLAAETREPSTGTAPGGCTTGACWDSRTSPSSPVR